MQPTLIGRRVKIIGNSPLEHHIGTCMDFEEKVFQTDRNGTPTKEVDRDESRYRISFGFNSIRVLSGWNLTTLKERNL